VGEGRTEQVAAHFEREGPRGKRIEVQRVSRLLER